MDSNPNEKKAKRPRIGQAMAGADHDRQRFDRAITPDTNADSPAEGASGEYQQQRRPAYGPRPQQQGGYNRYGNNQGGYGNNRPQQGGYNRYGNNQGGGYNNRYGNNQGGGYGNNRPQYQPRPQHDFGSTPAEGAAGETPAAESTGAENQNTGYSHNNGYTPRYGNNQGGGYNNRQQGGGYNRQQGGYNNRQQQGGGYNRQQGGYNNRQQQGGGYNRQQGGYGNRQQQGGGYNRQQGGYGNRPQQGGYNNRQQGGGYNRRPTNHDGTFQARGKSFTPRPKRIEYEMPIPDPNEQIRLNKFMSNAGICSRREADEFIQQGLVKVNGEVVTELGTKISHNDVVEYDEKVVMLQSKCYILLNKPKDCVTTSDDPNGRTTVMDLVKGACSERIYPVGRLDRNTTGVLLLTNDGDLASKLTHPKYVKKKIYHVWCDRDITEDDMQRIADGIELEDGPIHADAISYATETDRNQAGIEIHSGRNRIVRRM